ncbi:phosphonate C-P lyase system protein PhnL [Methylosinus sp. Sm6]|uniref:phosphonate C-P lyase system protein PhnL n=1 Tax=Methylosinus sp. Sm6 TaxID=2866948 RepID=UPI001C99A4CC|nr:phosphonate C-P lyase system protein PhnL [Methylosinus sp. Sm6]MBY6241509.1 phosphonate C-P lyase system protein PhnL [Methylosinus sp. Sm6]
MSVQLHAEGLSKTFTLHTQGGARLPVFENIGLTVHAGECVCLDGPSGSGKSTLLRSLYANYKPQAGAVHIRHDGEMIDMVVAPPWKIVEIRRRTIGYVSQFLRVIPRISTLNIVVEPAVANGRKIDDAYASARRLLERLDIPERLWSLAPATFSGGEQQRVNIARGFVFDYPILLLDEPTASLDAGNKKTVVSLIAAAKARGAAIVGIFHDAEMREAVGDRIVEMNFSAGRIAATRATIRNDVALSRRSAPTC